MLLDTTCNEMGNLTVRLKRVRPTAIVPTYGTTESACFDLYACLDDKVAVWTTANDKDFITVDESGSIIILPKERVLIPTGFIFGIQVGYSMRIHPHSGLAAKNGIIVANCEGIIDCDYPEETFVLLTNISDCSFNLSHGDPIAQAEIVPVNRVSFVLTEENPIANPLQK